MNPQKSARWLLVLLLATLSSVQGGEIDEYYYAIEQSGVICGYAHAVVSQAELDGRPALHLQDSLWMKVVALGKSIEGQYLFEYYLNPDSAGYFLHTSDISQETVQMSATMTVDGDSIRILSEPDHDTTVIYLPDDVILQNTRIHKFLVEDFVRDTLSEKTYRVFNEADGTINEATYTKVGIEKLELAGVEYEALALTMLNRSIGIQAEVWLDAATGLMLKSVHPIRSIYLTDAGVVDKIRQVDIDEKIFARVGVVISNPLAISYMKVRARLQPGGMWLTPKALNVPGQRFEGTVKDNLVEGVFEVTHERYDGAGAPPFPPDFSDDETLQEYLEPADMIESDHPKLIAEAVKITDGATDSWEAAKRLSRWVSDEIAGDVPGGVTAIRTYEIRLGECGSHSNLVAAFCRAVGIPCRVAFGCMYVPDHGGAFGQHAWDEVYMGDVGWVPIDATVGEIDYVDCGHIRLGEWKSKAAMFNPQEMEILEYRVGEGTYANLEASGEEADYQHYVGRYQGEERVLTILIQNQSLALDIPGRMVFELKDPNEKGEWFFKLTETALVRFSEDSHGTVNAMIIDSRQRFPRKPDSDTVGIHLGVPEQFRPVVGAYAIPMQSEGIDVTYDDDQLALVFPGQSALPLAHDQQRGKWVGKAGSQVQVEIDFARDENDQVIAMLFSEVVHCPRLEEAAEN